MDAHGYVMATIPATTAKPDVPVIGFIAHVDTSPEMSGAGVKPIVHRDYDGRDLVLPDDPEAVLRVADSPVPWRVPRPRHRHRVGHDAARRRQQERRGRDHDRGRVPDGASRDPARGHPHRLHAGRGSRPRHRALRRGPLRRPLRLHDGRRAARRARVRELLGRCDHADLPRLQHASGLRQGPHGQRDQAGGALHRPAAAPIACRRKRPAAARASSTPMWCRPPWTARR